MSQYPMLRGLSILAGGALVFTQAKANVEAIGSIESSLGIAAVVVPVAMVVTVAVLEARLQARHYGLAALAAVVLFCGVAHTLVTALERAVHEREKLTAARTDNTARVLATEALAAARQRVTELQGKEDTACKKPGKPCDQARANVAAARQQAEDAQRKLAVAAPAVAANGMVERYGSLAHAIDTWHPVLMPAVMELGALSLIGFGLSGRRREVRPEAVPLTAAAVPVEAPIPLRAVPYPKLSVRKAATLTGQSKSAVHRERQRAKA